MRTLAWAALAVSVAVPPPAAGGRPDWYGTVASVHWVVRDLEAVKREWGKLGFPARVDFGDVDLPVRVGVQWTNTRLRVALALIDDLQVYWLQPLDATGPYAVFLKQHGDGIFSLNHAAPSAAALDEEIARLKALGVEVLQSSAIDTDSGPLRIVHMDTAGEGKFVLGLVHGIVPGAAVPATTPPIPSRRSHFAFVAKDLKAVSSYWNRLGLPAFEATRTALRDRAYRGRPAAFEEELGWQRHGPIGFEWIRSLAGPTVYDDFTAAHGEGLHHIAFEVEALDKALAIWREAGLEVVQSGAWGTAGKPGSGRYAYLDTSAAGGLYVELLSVRR